MTLISFASQAIGTHQATSGIEFVFFAKTVHGLSPSHKDQAGNISFIPFSSSMITHQITGDIEAKNGSILDCVKVKI
jgi:hypothetical protein